MLESKSIKSRLLFYLLMSLVPILLALFYLAEGYIRNILYDSTVSQAKMSATKAARQIEHLTSSIAMKPEEIADIVGQEISDIPKTELLMSQTVQANKYIYGMALAFLPEFSPHGHFYCSYFYLHKGQLIKKQLVPPAYDYLSYEWFSHPVRSGRNMWSEPYYDKGGGESWMSTFSAVIHNPNGQTIGVATADVSIRFLSRIIQRIQILKTGRAFLFTKAGNIIAPANATRTSSGSVYRITESLSGQYFKNIAHRVALDNQLFCTLEHGGKTFFVYYLPVRKTDWIIGVAFPKTELFAPVRRIEYYSSLMILAVIFIIVGILTLVSRNVTRDIERIKSISLEIAQGNFNVEIPDDFTYEAKSIANALNAMQTSLKEYIEEVREKARIENELRVAHAIQASFVPNDTDVRIGSVRFKAVSMWAKQVGGDFYGVHKIAEGKVLFYLGDVSGKGIPAVLYVAMIKGMIEVLADRTHSIQELVGRINTYFATVTKHHNFATMFIGMIDADEGMLRYANLGHLPPIFIQGNVMSSPILSENLPVGVFAGSHIRVDSVGLESVDQILLFSDGVLDAEDEHGNRFGDDRLMQSISDCSFEHGNLIVTLKRRLKDFMGSREMYDDTTILHVMKIN